MAPGDTYSPCARRVFQLLEQAARVLGSSDAGVGVPENALIDGSRHQTGEALVYVAESGTAEVTGPCAAVYRGQNCYSGTGAISRLWKGTQERIVSGLPSVYLAEFNDITGPHHLPFQGRGGMYVAIGWGGHPRRAQVSAGSATISASS